MDITITINMPDKQAPPPAPVRTLPEGMRFVRVLHEAELPASRRITPAKMPEVRPLFPNHYSPFGEGWQNTSWTLNRLLTANNMTAVYDDALWIANNTGFGGTPRRNYFIPEDLDAKEGLRVEALTCGGNILHVIGEGAMKTNSGIEQCYFVETLDYRVVPLYTLEDKPWLVTTATKLDPYGNPTRFPQGRQPNGYQPGVRHPLVADTVRYPQIGIPKWRCVEWTEAYAPDPYKVYIKA